MIRLTSSIVNAEIVHLEPCWAVMARDTDPFHDFEIAYCSTRAEAEEVIRALNNLASILKLPFGPP